MKTLLFSIIALCVIFTQSRSQEITRSNQIRSKVIEGRSLKDSTITADKIATGVITSGTIADSSITSAKLAQGIYPPDTLIKNSKIGESGIIAPRYKGTTKVYDKLDLGGIGIDTVTQVLGIGYDDNNGCVKFDSSGKPYMVGLRYRFETPSNNEDNLYSWGVESRNFIRRVRGPGMVGAGAIAGGVFLSDSIAAQQNHGVLGGAIQYFENYKYPWQRRFSGVTGRTELWRSGGTVEVGIGVWAQRARLVDGGDTYPDNNFSLLVDGMATILGDGGASEDTTGASLQFRNNLLNADNYSQKILLDDGTLKIVDNDDNLTMAFDQTNEVGIGKIPTSPLDILHNSSATAIGIENDLVTGYSGINLKDNSSTTKGSFAYSNSSASLLPGVVWIGNRGTTLGNDFVIVSNGTSERIRVTKMGGVIIGAGTEAGSSNRTLGFGEISAVPTPGANTPIIYGEDDGTISQLVAKNDNNEKIILTSAGLNAFTTSATSDTVVVSGTTSSSLFNITIKDLHPVADDLLSYTTTTDTLFVHRTAGTTSGLQYSWQRIR